MERHLQETVRHVEKGQGLAIESQGKLVRLKWHQLRRSRRDRVFSSEVLAAGLQLGASMELDLRVRADGGFVVLHDERLEDETTGTGIIAEMNREDVFGLRLLDGSPVLLSEELSELLSSTHEKAVLQLDMQDDLATIGARGIQHLSDRFGRARCPLIINGYDIDLIVAARDLLPFLRRGIDPSPKLVALEPNWQQVAAVMAENATGAGAPEMIYLQWDLLLRAAEHGVDLVQICHARGIEVDAWTFNLADPTHGFSQDEWEQFSALIALQPDQITTDDALAIERAWTMRNSA